jgi:hypothetical protein
MGRDSQAAISANSDGGYSLIRAALFFLCCFSNYRGMAKFTSTCVETATGFPLMRVGSYSH